VDSLKVFKLDDKHVFLFFLLTVMVPFGTFFSWWAISANPSIDIMRPDLYRPSLNYQSCRYSNPNQTTAAASLIAIFWGAGALVTCFFAWRSTSITDTTYDDTKPITAATFLVTVLAAIVAGIQGALQNNHSLESILYIIRSMGILLMPISSMVIIGFPRLATMMGRQDIRRTSVFMPTSTSGPRHSSSGGRHSSNGASPGSSQGTLSSSQTSPRDSTVQSE
jgi:hypothetical protein